MKNLILLTILALATMFVACEQQELLTEEFTNVAETSIPIADLSDESNAVGMSRNLSTVFTLYGGQTIEAGEVTLVIDEAAGTATITYTTNDNWTLGTTHLYIGDCDEMPMTRKGNPKIGHFPYTTEGELAQNEAGHSIQLADFLDKFEQTGVASGCFCLAAHAELLRAASSNDTEGGSEETGWADWNTEFDGNRWGGYNEICL